MSKVDVKGVTVDVKSAHASRFAASASTQEAAAAVIINRPIPPLYTGDVKTHAALPLKTQFLYAKLKALEQTATDTKRRQVYESGLSEAKTKSDKELQSIVAAYNAKNGTVDQVRARGFVRIFDLSIPAQRESARPYVGKFVQDNPRGQSVKKYWAEIQELLPKETAASLKTDPDFVAELEEKFTGWPLQSGLWDLSYEANRHWNACACEQPTPAWSKRPPKSSCSSLCKCYLLVLFYLLDSGEFHPIGMVYAFVSQDFQRMAIQGITASVALAFAKTLYPKAPLPIINSFLIPTALNLARQLGMTELYVNPVFQQKKILREHYGFELMNGEPLKQGQSLYGTACNLIDSAKLFRRITIWEESATAAPKGGARAWDPLVLSSPF